MKLNLKKFIQRIEDKSRIFGMDSPNASEDDIIELLEYDQVFFIKDKHKNLEDLYSYKYQFLKSIYDDVINPHEDFSSVCLCGGQIKAVHINGKYKIPTMCAECRSIDIVHPIPYDLIRVYIKTLYGKTIEEYFLMTYKIYNAWKKRGVPQRYLQMFITREKSSDVEELLQRINDHLDESIGIEDIITDDIDIPEYTFDFPFMKFYIESFHKKEMCVYFDVTRPWVSEWKKKGVPKKYLQMFINKEKSSNIYELFTRIYPKEKYDRSN